MSTNVSIRRLINFPRELPRVNPWYAAFIVLNAALSAATWAGLRHGGDFDVLVRAARLAGAPELYDLNFTSTFVWSPVAAYPLKLIAPIGLEAWRVVLVAAALAMPSWKLRLVVLVSWPFWTDFTTGNLLTVVFLSAVWALRGSKLGTIAFFTIALLIPRPLLVPIGLWILSNRPEWRAPFAAMFLINAVLLLLTGLVPEWISTLLAIGPELQSLPLNVGPTRLFGWWWMIVGIPLGAWLLWRGRLGWAGLAISNYIWIYYWYFALPEVNRARGVSADSSLSDQPAATAAMQPP